MALAHNGALSVTPRNSGKNSRLRGSIFHTSSDTEVISYVITQERLKSPSIEEAVSAGDEAPRGRVFRWWSCRPRS